MKALLLDGSPAVHSHTAALLRELHQRLQEQGYDTETISLHKLGLPVNDPEYHPNPQDHPDQKVRHFADKVATAQVIVLGTPLYHGSFSGLMKSALDHLIDEAFKDKAVGVVSNAAGIRVSQQGAQYLAVVARTMCGRVSHRLIGTTKSDYTQLDNGEYTLSDEAIIQRCDVFIHDLLDR